MVTNVRLPKIDRILPKMIFSPPSRWQNLGLGTNPIEIAEPCYPHDKFVASHLCDACLKTILTKRLLQAPVHLVTDPANLFTDQRMSGPPICAAYKHFKTFLSILDNSPTD